MTDFRTRQLLKIKIKEDKETQPITQVLQD